MAGSFAALMKVHGEPSRPELFFVIGSCAGFAVVNVLSTRFFREESPDEPEVVISLATSLSVFSVCGSIGVVTGIAYALAGWPAWPLGAFVLSMIYIVGVGAEIGFAAHRHPEGR